MSRTPESELFEGLTDIELAAELEHAVRLEGHPGIIRMRRFNGEMLFAHVMSGPDSAVPAYLDTPLGGVGPHSSFGQGAGSDVSKHINPSSKIASRNR